MSDHDVVALLFWAITGIIPETECPIARETMWRDQYAWERSQVDEWIDLGGEGSET